MNTAGFFNFPDAQTWNPHFKLNMEGFVKNRVGKVKPLSGMLAMAYAEKAKRQDYVQANIELRAATDKLQRHDLNLSWPDDELGAWCERKAKKGHEFLRRAEITDDAALFMEILANAEGMVSKYGIETPDLETVGPYWLLRRIADPKWWRLKARRLQAREVERLAILLRRVRKDREIYCSNETVRRRSAQKHRNRKYLEATEAENENGQRYTLAELADLSVSNPKIRRGELMLRVRGFDEVAQTLGHIREFWTLTAPSRFHRWTTVGNVVRDNKHWDGSTPKQAQQWLSKMWSRVRTALSRIKVRLYGFRVVEAHHDGTPHWHAAIFYTPTLESGNQATPEIHRIVKKYFIEGDAITDATERGAEAHRVKFDTIDPERGDAAGYLAKYITKAIAADDAGDLVQQDLYGYDAGDSARRVEAWASCHGIRQFQQIGGPSVTAWRELRRAMADELASADLTDLQGDLFGQPNPVYRAATAADEGDWQAFVLLMGGPCVKRADQLLRLGYWNEHDPETGEVVGKVFNRYGEAAPACVFGLTYDGGDKAILTRTHTWTIHREGEEKPAAEADLNVMQQARDTIRRNVQEFKPWVFDFLKQEEAEYDQGFWFSGAPPGAPLEFCQ